MDSKKRLYFCSYVGGDTSIYSTKCGPYKGVPFSHNVRLFHSRLGSTWSENWRGKLAGRLVDDGNGVTLELGEKRVRLDYDELLSLEILLKEYERIIPSGLVIKSTPWGSKE